MEHLTKCLLCGGTGFVEVVDIIGEDNDSVECPACDVVGYVEPMPF